MCRVKSGVSCWLCHRSHFGSELVHPSQRWGLRLAQRIVASMLAWESMSDGMPAIGESEGEQDEPSRSAEDEYMWASMALDGPETETHGLAVSEAQLPVAEPTASSCAGDDQVCAREPIAVRTPRKLHHGSPGSSTGTPPKTPDEKRRRLRGKQPLSPPPVPSPLVSASYCAASFNDDPLLHRFSKLASADQARVRNSMRQRKSRVSKKLSAGASVLLKEKLFELPQNKNIDTKTFWREFYIDWFAFQASDSQLDPDLRGCAMEHTVKLLDDTASRSDDKSMHNVMRNRSVLLTYNGPWGVFLELSPPPTSSIDDVVAVVAKHQPAVTLFQECTALFEDLKNKTKIQHYSVAMELCTATWKQESEVRVHFHVWILKKQYIAAPEDFVFKKSKAHVNADASEFVGSRGSRSASASYAGAFYVSCCKAGRVQGMSTIEPFVDYSVKDYWVTTLLAQKKIALVDARKYFYLCVSRADHNVRLVDFIETYWRRLEEETAREAAETLICNTECGFKTLPEVAEWNIQYKKVQSRYKFLVLDGKSQTGKTRFAYSLYVPQSSGLSPPPSSQAIFYADCSGGLPDLRDFRHADHKLLILDELGPKGAVVIKKIMQASNDVAVLGSSPTMQHVYRVRTWRTMIVVTTNTWSAGLHGMPPADYEWLEANSVHVVVTSPLWIVP